MKITRLIAATAALAIVLLAARPWFLTYCDDQYRQQHPTHEYRVTFNNNLNRGYIWINRNVIVHIWDEEADAAYAPEQMISGTLDLQSTRSHTGFLLPASSSASGTLTLPADYQLNKYIRNHNRITFAVHLLIDDIYVGTEDFVPNPQLNFDAAFFEVETNTTQGFSEVLFSYPDGI